MWRISSVAAAITALPIYIPLIFVLADWLRWVMDSQKLFFFVLFCLEVHILYIIARAVILILAFTSLRDLPPRAVYETVNWTTFIPHV